MAFVPGRRFTKGVKIVSDRTQRTKLYNSGQVLCGFNISFGLGRDDLMFFFAGSLCSADLHFLTHTLNISLPLEDTTTDMGNSHSNDPPPAQKEENPVQRRKLPHSTFIKQFTQNSNMSVTDIADNHRRQFFFFNLQTEKRKERKEGASARFTSLHLHNHQH